MGKHNRTNYSGFYEEPKQEEATVVEVFSEVEPETIEVAEETKTAKVTTDRLYVRAQPYAGAKELTIVEKNDKLKVVEILDGWYEVITPSGDEGYVMEAYVEIV